ncbi:MAG: hypothetical protein COB69_10510 [Phycisphaera sp.]|nr:MAG: hypothetical protein COB69_10510 [Phycisphaera sp.]
MTINDEQLDTMLASIASQDWNGPSFNQRVEQEILEREHAMDIKKRTLWMAGIVVGASLISAGVAAAVTHRIVTQRVHFVLDDGSTFSGDAIMNADGTSGFVIAGDGVQFEIESQPDTSEQPTHSPKPK